MALLLLAACGSSKAASDPPRVSSSTAATTATLTTAQEASKVAENGPKILDDLAAVKAGCDGVAGTCTVIGGISLDSAHLDAESLVEALRTGGVPAELTQLVTATIAATASVDADANKLFTNDTACKGKEPACAQDLLMLGVDGDALSDVLNGWKPYGA